MPNYNKQSHQIGIIDDAIRSLRKSIDYARKEVNTKYLNKEITLYEMTNQLWIFDFFDKFLAENWIKNYAGLTGLLELYESCPYPTKKHNEEFNALRFYLCDMVGIDKVEQELESFNHEGI